ncbi:hypothetical protein ACFFMP_02320 [Pseudoroseomonas cervicalis]|uniref:hypothetical protein n=1 Tax=Teichococcus cervicalis TaxID=204525 RepID=UPI0035E5481A
MAVSGRLIVTLRANQPQPETLPGNMVGSSITIYADVRDERGAWIDVQEPVMLFRRPRLSNRIRMAGADVQRLDIGRYAVRLLPDIAGTWSARFEVSGPIIAAGEIRFPVPASAVVSPAPPLPVLSDEHGVPLLSGDGTPITVHFANRRPVAGLSEAGGYLLWVQNDQFVRTGLEDFRQDVRATAGDEVGQVVAERTTYTPHPGSPLQTPLVFKSRQRPDLESDFGAKLDGSSDDTAAHVDAARSGRVVKWPPVAATMRIYDEAILDDRPAQIFGVMGKSRILLGTYAQRAYRLLAGGNTLSGLTFQGTTVNGRKPFIQGNSAYPMLYGDQAYTSAAAVFCLSGYNRLLNLGFFDLPTGMRVRSFDRASQQVLRNEVVNPYGERCDFGMIGGNQRAGRFVGWGFGASTFETSNAPNHDVYFAGKFPKGMPPEEGDDPTNEGPTGFFDTLTENCLFESFISTGNLYSSVFKFTGMKGCTIRNMQSGASVCLLSLAYMRGCTVDGATIYDLRQGLTPAGEPNTSPTNQGGVILSDCHDMDLFGLTIAGRSGDNHVNGVLLRDGSSDIRLRTGTISMGYTAATPDRSALRITRGSTRTYVGPGMTLRHAGGNKPLVLVSASTDTVLDSPVLQQGDAAATALVSVDSASTGTRWRREELASRSAPGSALANAAPGTVLQRPAIAPLLWRPTELGAARVLTLSAKQPGAVVTDAVTGLVTEWRDYYTPSRRLVAASAAEGGFLSS